ncbi:MAG: ATP-binding cassette domain-containing protein [Methylohalobius sp.]|nr:ATP-binding cassette domain-containing protein [Methylohalobius sp.]
MNLALEVENLSFAYGPKKALDEVSFAVPQGVCTILLGPNGAGKTTLFNLITRLFDSPTGTIRIAGFDHLRRPNQALARMGVVFQQPTLDLDLTVEQNLRYFAALHGLSRKQAGSRVGEELERFDLVPYRKSKVRALSGGYRRRVEIARALLHRPKLLLLDEPTVGLDIPSRKALVDHVHGLASEGIGVLWATHLLDEVEAGDQLIILHRGRIRAIGCVTEVIERLAVTSLSEAFQVLTKEAA